MILVDDIAGARSISFPGAGGMNLWIWMGTALFTYKGGPGGWQRDYVVGDIIPNFDVFAINQFQIAAAASLASISNDGVATNAGWAVDQIVADRVHREEDNASIIRWRADIGVNDIDGYVRRLAYQVFVTGILTAVAS